MLDRGYTGHEHLWTVALVHMNARLYDPKLHRFLQPDNFVQDPSNTQNYNRYGYCWNNPLKYSDPSGDFTWSDLLAAVSIVTGAVLVIVSGGTLTPLAQAFIGAGVAHFGATFAMYSNNKAGGWDAASNYVGFSSPTIDIKTGWGDSGGTPKNGINKATPINEATPSSSGIATGSEMSVNFFNPNDSSQSHFNDVFKYNKRKGFGAYSFDFQAFGHGNVDENGYGFFQDNKRQRFGDYIDSAREFDAIMSDLSPAYKNLIGNNLDPINLTLNFCQSGNGKNSMAAQISYKHPYTRVVGYEGYALYGQVNGIPMIHAVSSTMYVPTNSFGYRVIYQGGILVSRVLYSDFLKSKK